MTVPLINGVDTENSIHSSTLVSATTATAEAARVVPNLTSTHPSAPAASHQKSSSTSSSIWNNNHNVPYPPVCPKLSETTTVATLVLKDGTAYHGYSFGAETHSIAGECVFQTGMVGYPESLTDPSYRGQILVPTFPLIGNYGVPSREDVDITLHSLQTYFESTKIHVAALVIGSYPEEFSHYLAKSSLSTWLKESNIPAIYGIDTRALTKKIRTTGAILGKILFPKSVLEKKTSINHLTSEKQDIGKGNSNNWMDELVDVPWHDPNTRHLVAEVSVKQPITYSPSTSASYKYLSKNKTPLRVLAVDVGMKNNQIRCLVKRGVEVKVVPYNYDFVKDQDWHGLFISNGPGDPTTCSETIDTLSRLLKTSTSKPIFGICLGHQLLALASGAQTEKMLFGNRGHNIPCTDVRTNRCYITSQNHGYAVKNTSLSSDWQEWFVNANDGSNEGISHKSKPWFSVQFHPESTPGPWDTEWLFDEFIECIHRVEEGEKIVTVKEGEKKVPCRVYPKKVLILGSGGLSIGQAGEFDYSGSQAIKALREEGIYTILVNPNIATIQTSKGLADKIYFLPVTPDYVRKVIKHEKPDGIYCTFGGQTALNVGVKLKNEFEGLGVKVLGTPISVIEVTEDRELFAQSMAQINEKCAQSASATSVSEAVAAASKIGYPVIVRAAYALGGLGSGFAETEEELRILCGKAFASSPQVLVERSMKGWKEIEYEVVRDVNDNCITVCNMENFDPLGIHTGDSIVVAPSQTLSDEDYMMLRRTAVNVIRHLGVIGECNIQYALNPNSKEYCIIEVNARLSRSSALASKATGYPLAFVAAKLGLGIPLTEVKNSVTRKTIACFEPSLDYIVVKIPRWDLKKFNRVSTKISSSMKSVGEVMAIGKTFEETMQKALRAVDGSFIGFAENDFINGNDSELKEPTDQRIFALANALHHGYTVDRIWELTKIDKWFLHKLKGIVDLDKHLAKNYNPQNITIDVMRTAKQMGFSDRQIAKAIGSSELAIRILRTEWGITPFVKQIDTVAAEFPCYTNYLYMTYNAMEHDVQFEDNGIMVLGSGVYRIGSSVEFDWCAVRSIRTLRAHNIKTIMVNYNPETVSTDYDEADRLYFETLTLERVLDIYELEKSNGVIISMGGQIPNNIALPLHRHGVKILGTSPTMIDSAENRYKFSRMLDKIEVDQPKWKELSSIEEAKLFCQSAGYPVLVRPSYVLSGAAMNVVYSEADLQNLLERAAAVSKEHPVVISKFIEEAKEIEMDAVAVDGKVVMHVITEHVENAGVHSGDATLVLPPQDLDPETVRKIEAATRKIGQALNVTGPFNIQFIAKNNEIKVIECNVRSSRSFPFVSKVLGVDLIEIATKAMIGIPFEPYPKIDIRPDYVAVKVPQFSFSRLSGADPVLGVEMASTGEVACFGKDKYEAYIKALISTGFILPKKNILLSIGSYKEKQEFLPSVQRLHQLGYNLFATTGTADFINEHNIPVKYLESLDGTKDAQEKSEYSLTQHLANNLIDLYINLPSKNQFRRPASYVSRGYRSRRMAVDFSIPLITNVKCAKLFVEALGRKTDFEISNHDYMTSHRTMILPGLVNIASYFPEIVQPESKEFSGISKSALAGGFTFLCNMPMGISGVIKDRSTMTTAQENCRGKSYCDFSLSTVATSDNASQVSTTASDSAALYICVDAKYPNCHTDISKLVHHLKAWPSTLPIVVSAKKNDLASVLFLANLYNRSIHVTQISSAEDIGLIALSKEKGIKVTCDVAVHHLFLSTDDYPTASKILGTPDDVQVLWDNLDIIDCLSVGDVAYNLAKELGYSPCPASGIEDVIPLLMTAVSDGKLTLDYVISRLSENPRSIFDIPMVSSDTYVEVEIDRKHKVPNHGHHHHSQSLKDWTPFEGQIMSGIVHRVVLNGNTVYLDDSFFGETQGRNESNLVRVIAKNLEVRRVSRHDSIHDIVSPRARSIETTLPIIKSRSPPPPTNSITGVSSGVSNNASGGVGPGSLSNLNNSLVAVGGSGGAISGSSSSAAAGVGGGVSGSGEMANNLLLRGPSSMESSKLMRALQSGLSQSLISFLSKSPFLHRNILSVKQFTRSELHVLFGVAQEMRTIVERQGGIQLLQGRVMCSAFFEPSTRTSGSFEAAMVRLGGSVVKIDSSTSSVVKGETLSDTVRTLGCYGDVLVVRHPSPGSAEIAAKYTKIPVINAGDGIGEHPTQAFLDVFTIREELGTVNGLTITIVGDLKNGRTVHSLVKLLCNYDVTLNYVSPDNLKMPEEVKAEVAKCSSIRQTEYPTIESVIESTDVLYVTRIQKERFTNLEEYESTVGTYIVTNSIMTKAKPHMIVMHPLPRVNEIAVEVDFDQRAAYFRQMRYGLYVRMALLALVVGHDVKM